MKKQIENYRRYIFLGIIIISLGITFNTTLKDVPGSLGTVFIAVGGLFFIIGMSKKSKVDKQNNK
ncbi:MAG: hypothetical protein R3342_03805 [Lutibacter sp.]|uniref:hypothetical protein n=1 Tax=Lutibacter sp. TaxID=1925666 RepID=UPI00299EB6E6|nr:hypothetical protein [Lutibacter sp.]MDX1828652.1 hypothetical protein [Lutibacter sp.]